MPMFLQKNAPKLSLQLQIAQIELIFIFLFLSSNRRILHWSIKVMCGIFFKKIDQIDCKIIAYKVKKIAFFAPCKIRVSRPWIPLVNFFPSFFGVEVFDVIVVKWVKNPPIFLKKDLKKTLFFHYLNDL
jgi:hypothetical protein